jgi:AraC family transcriptional regulator
VAAQLDRDPATIEIADRFQMRDPVIEHIGWTLKADIDSNLTGGRLLRDSLGVALAARLLQRHYRGSLPMREIRGGLSHTKLERVIAHIEDNLASKLSLPGIAEIAGISVSHLKTLFRNSTGVPVYEYVLRRRVERAQLLLRNQRFSIAEVAWPPASRTRVICSPHASHTRLHAVVAAQETSKQPCCVRVN